MMFDAYLAWLAGNWLWILLVALACDFIIFLALWLISRGRVRS